MRIAEQSLEKQHQELTDGARGKLNDMVKALVVAPNAQNGNGRAIRNILEIAMRKQALRLAEQKGTMKPHQLSLLTEEDFS